MHKHQANTTQGRRASIGGAAFVVAALMLTSAGAAQAQTPASFAQRHILDRAFWERVDWNTVQASEVWKDPAFADKPAQGQPPRSERKYQNVRMAGLPAEFSRREEPAMWAPLRHFALLTEGLGCEAAKQSLEQSFGPAQAYVRESVRPTAQTMSTYGFGLWKVGGTGVALECSETAKDRIALIDYRAYDERLKPAPMIRLHCDVRAKSANSGQWTPFGESLHLLVLPNARMVTDEQMRLKADEVKISDTIIDIQEETRRASRTYIINRVSGEIYGVIRGLDGSTPSGEIMGRCMRRESEQRAF